MSEAFDVVVVGAGPGGMAAATVASERGLRVGLIDDNRGPGGQIWRGFDQVEAAKYPHGHTFLEWAGRLQKTSCEIRSGWQVAGSVGEKCLRIEREGRVCDIGFGTLILSTGARERFLPFPGWTLPGVMGAGGLQALVKSGLDARGKRVVVAGTGPLLLAIAAGLSDAGATIVAIYEQAPLTCLLRLGVGLTRHPAKLVEGAQYRMKTRRAPYRMSAWVTAAEGVGHLKRVTATNGKEIWKHDCDWLACGFHLVPNCELPQLLGCRLAESYVEVDAMQRTSVPGVACVGELTGIGGMDKAIVEGQVAAFAAAGCAAEASRMAKRLGPHKRLAYQLDEAFALRDELRGLARPETFVCRCEDVRYSELSGRSGWREAKLHTRCGMGACQGRICGAATEFMFGWQTSGVRPPAFPANVGAIAPKAQTQDSVCV